MIAKNAFASQRPWVAEVDLITRLPSTQDEPSGPVRAAPAAGIGRSLKAFRFPRTVHFPGYTDECRPSAPGGRHEQLAAVFADMLAKPAHLADGTTAKLSDPRRNPPRTKLQQRRHVRNLLEQAISAQPSDHYSRCCLSELRILRAEDLPEPPVPAPDNAPGQYL